MRRQCAAAAGSGVVFASVAGAIQRNDLRADSSNVHSAAVAVSCGFLMPSFWTKTSTGVVAFGVDAAGADAPAAAEAAPAVFSR